jgi:hypothetical protein
MKAASFHLSYCLTLNAKCKMQNSLQIYLLHVHEVTKNKTASSVGNKR